MLMIFSIEVFVNHSNPRGKTGFGDAFRIIEELYYIKLYG